MNEAKLSVVNRGPAGHAELPSSIVGQVSVDQPMNFLV